MEYVLIQYYIFNAQENLIPLDIINITSIPVSPVNMKNTTNNMISETFSLKIEENTSNLEIVDNVHVENIEQDIKKEYVCSNDEKPIEQKEQNKENQNIESESCDIDELQLLETIRQLVHICIFNILLFYIVLVKYLEN